jgi:adenylosuccinate synthase
MTSDTPTGSAATTGAPAPGAPGAPGSAAAVVGLQWGDEGKGKLIDVMASGFDAVVRFNGGANAGHSVVIGGRRFALHLIPSGILHEGVLSVIGNGVVVDPIALVEEIDGIEQRGVDTSNLVLSERAHLVLPYHIREDEQRERALAGAGGRDRSIGTTKRGIGPAYADKALRSTAVRAGDLRDPDALVARLRAIAPAKNALLGAFGAPPLEPEALAAELEPVAERLRPRLRDTTYLLHGLLAGGRSILFEGANATLLDVDHGTYPFVTSSGTTALGISSGSGVPAQRVGSIVGVMKAYTTRVGAGPMPTELHDADGDRIRERGNEFGTTTGRPRRCGWLDLVAARYAVMVNGATEVALTLLDVLSGFEELRVCTAYRLADGTTTDRFLPDARSLESIEPVYETLPGFAEDVTGVTTRAGLPDNARRYIDFVESFVGVRISTVGVGPDRAQTITG